MRLSLFFSLLILFVYSANCQQIDYNNLFGDDWKNAEIFLSENQSAIKEKLSQHQIDYDLAMAIVFPELVRFNGLRDKMETALLKSLYVNYGKTYANFSIGQLQMKPSFAEQLSAALCQTSISNYKSLIADSSKYEEEWEFRQAIVKDLENFQTQLNYLIVFIKICESRFSFKKMNDDQLVRFMATAYNAGFDNSEKKIWMMSKKKFYSPKLFSTEHYAYADVAAFWYKQHHVSK